MTNGIEAYREKAAALRQIGRETFFPWFSGLRDIELAFTNGGIIFREMILPFAQNWLADLKRKSALEIGYGGGALLAEAAKHFGRVCGIDIHQERDFVSAELTRRGAPDVSLLISGTGLGDALPERKFDFIYAFTVFGHLSGFDVLQSYIQALPSVLTRRGIALLNFNRLVRTKLEQSLEEVQADLELEKNDAVGWQHRDVTVNQIGLRVASWKMEAECSLAGLQVREMGPTGFPHKEKGILYGGQAYVVVSK